MTTDRRFSPTLDPTCFHAQLLATLVLAFVVLAGTGLGAHAQTIDLTGLETATVVATAAPGVTAAAAAGAARADSPPVATLEMETHRPVVPPRLGQSPDDRDRDRARDGSWRLNYVRWATGAGQSSFGLSLGFGLQRTPPAALAPHGANGSDLRLAPEFGVRWRTPWRQDRRVDVDAWRSYDAEELASGAGRGERQGWNNARVELQFRDPGDDGRLNIPRGAFGIQTSANSQWVLRAKRGGPMVYYRARW